MNKINETFNKIKASEELKEKTYLKIIRQKKTRTIKTPLLTLSFALTSILILFMIYNYNDEPNKEVNGDTFMINETSDDSINSITYNGYTYVEDSSVISSDMLDENLGPLDNYSIRSDLMEASTLSDDKAFVYSIKDSSNIAVVRKDKITVYVKISE